VTFPATIRTRVATALATRNRRIAAALVVLVVVAGGALLASGVMDGAPASASVVVSPPGGSAEVPAGVLIEDGGPAFPLPPGAVVQSSRAVGAAWRLVADAASGDAQAFYAALADPAWPATTADDPGSLAFTDASGRFGRAIVRLAGAAPSGRISVNFTPADGAEAIDTGEAEAGAQLLHLSLGPSDPDPGFPGAFRPAGLTILGEVESREGWTGLYEGDPALAETVVAALETAARSIGAVTTTRGTGGDVAVVTVGSTTVAAVRIVEGILEVAVEVPR
jgi:hypothetical protein